MPKITSQIDGTFHLASKKNSIKFYDTFQKYRKNTENVSKSPINVWNFQHICWAPNTCINCIAGLSARMVRWIESYHYIQSAGRQAPLFLWTLVEECAYDYESIGRRAQPSSACVFFFLLCEADTVQLFLHANFPFWAGQNLPRNITGAGEVLGKGDCWCVGVLCGACVHSVRWTSGLALHWGERLPIPARPITQNARSALHAF